MNYRKANINDINQLVELRKSQLTDEGLYSDIKIDDELKKYFSASIVDESIVVWVAYENDIIIGTCGVCLFQYPPNFSNTTGKVAYITNIYTRDEYRRQGIASKLLEYIIDEIKRRDYRFIRLHASAQGKPLYEKIGFVDVSGFMVKRL